MQSSCADTSIRYATTLRTSTTNRIFTTNRNPITIHETMDPMRRLSPLLLPNRTPTSDETLLSIARLPDGVFLVSKYRTIDH